MAFQHLAVCDVCGRIKGTANKWLLVLSWVPETVDSRAVPYFTIYFFSQSPPSGSKMVCGEECLHKLLRPFLDLRSRMVAPEEGHPAYVHAPVEETITPADFDTDSAAKRVPVQPE